jgi:tryptophanyl-tRNA synthetase
VSQASAGGVSGVGVFGLEVTIGDRPPADPARRRHVVHRFGTPRVLHLGDYLGSIRRLRALAADPLVDLTILIDAGPDLDGGDADGAADGAAHLAATLVACGLGSVSFAVDARDSSDVAEIAEEPALVSSADEVLVHDLRHPRIEMGAVPGDERGVVWLLDTPLRVAAAVRGAQTDLDPTLGYDPQLRPGVANLGVLTDRSPVAALFGLHGSSQLKRAVSDAVERRLRPVRLRYAELAADPETMRRLVEPNH